MKPRFLQHLSRLLAACTLGLACTAHAAYPSKPISIVVPFAAGGATDQLARLLAQRLGEALDVAVIVENKPGAGTVVAAAQVAKSAADGHTLFLTSNSTLVLNPVIRNDLPYDPLESYSYISRVAGMELVLVGAANFPEKTLEAVVARARANPDDLSYGSFGAGTTVHFGAEMLKSVAGISLTHIPFNGSTPNLTALLGEQIPLASDTLVATLPHIRAGKMHPIAIMSQQRSALLPDVPAVAETFPGFEMMSWFGMLAPAGLPEDIRQTLDDTFKEILQQQENQQRLVEMGLLPSYAPGAELLRQTREDLPRMQAIAKEAGIQAQ